MSIVTLVVVMVWDVLLLAALAAAIGWRTQLLRWVTGLDRQTRNRWDTSDDEAWSAFLAEHPELWPGGCGEDTLARPTDQLRPVRLQLHALRGQQMYVAPPGFVIPRQAQGAASAGSPVRWPGVSLTPPERQQLRLLVRVAAQKDQKFADPVALSSTIPADGPASTSRQSP